MAHSRLSLLVLARAALAAIDWEAAGAVPSSVAAAANNTVLLNAMLAKLAPGDVLLVSNKTFWVAGGVQAVGLRNVTLQVDGTLKWLPGRADWPTTHGASCRLHPLQPRQRGDTCVQEAVFMANSTNIRLTSSGTGTLDGNGASWWGYARYLLHGEDRPRLLSVYNSTDILLERWRFVDSAYWTFTARDVAHLEIRHCSIDNRVTPLDTHDVADLRALNTDGFDVSGRDIHIHHCEVWNQDDCFTIQPMDGTGINAHCTQNVLVEHVNASGLGLTVGAVHPSPFHNCIRNVTFRRARMHHTYKGIYIKSGNSDDAHATASISDVLYESIEMDQPSQVPIWIGPAQEADSREACSLLWPESPLARCPPPPRTVEWAGITLRDVTVRSAKQSPGVVLGNPERPMARVLFENVVFEQPGSRPWGDQFFKCEGVDGLANGTTVPAPPCFRRERTG